MVAGRDTGGSKGRLLMGGVLIVGTIAVAAWLINYTVATRNTRERAAQVIAETRHSFERVPVLAPAELDTLRTFRNADHVARAETLGIDRLETREDAARLAAEGKLVPLSPSPYYTVREMDHSVPYVTPGTARLLTLIGVRFHEALRAQGLPPYRFVITSATRSTEDQNRLQNVNANAAETSSHEFGTTVDLHYRDFVYAAAQDSVAERSGIRERLLRRLMAREYRRLDAERQDRLKAILGRVLNELQEEGKVLVIYERLQPVYHLTLGEEIQPREVGGIPGTPRPGQPPESQAAMAAP